MAREIKITETADDPMKVFKEVISIGFGVAFGVGVGMGANAMLPAARSATDSVLRNGFIGASGFVAEHYASEAMLANVNDIHESVILARLEREGKLKELEATEEPKK